MFPALVSRVSAALDYRQSLSLHVTFLSPDGGGKAPVERAKLLWPLLPVAGGVIRLWPDDCVTLGLGVGEGIETSLSLALGFAPVWSLIDAANLAAFPALEGIEALTIAVDHDPAGIAAAEVCASRWLCAGREVTAIKSELPGTDVNDITQKVTR
jgi:hypothetical protein